MYLKLAHTASQGYIAEILNPVYHGDEDIVTESNIKDKTKVISLSEVDYNLLDENKKSIILGITDNGFDTNSINETEKELMELRDVHPALYEFYLTKNGTQYRMYCSSMEKRAMIQDYEENQRFLELLKSSGFSYVDLSEECSLRKRLCIETVY